MGVDRHWDAGKEHQGAGTDPVSRVFQGQEAQGRAVSRGERGRPEWPLQGTSEGHAGPTGKDCWNRLQGSQLCPHTEIHSHITDTAVRKTKTIQGREGGREGVCVIPAKGKAFLSCAETQSGKENS